MTRTALLSVSDKSGIVAFAKGLAELGFELVSSGGTARTLQESGLAVIPVAEFTGSPEILDGRVKTLHPKVHGGILARDTDADRTDLQKVDGRPIDLVVCNLYPFESTVARGAEHDEVIENIDIGGPSMLRSAAKNHARVVVVVSPQDYASTLEALRKNNVDLAFRARLAHRAFEHTANYDRAIANYFAEHNPAQSEPTADIFPDRLELRYEKRYDCRYGENPHQRGAFYVEQDARAGSLARAESVGAGGKELSFNNLVDLDATLEAVREFEEPAAVVVKHTNPCGVAIGKTLEEAYRRAREADALSAFGGIAALNRNVDAKTADAIAETFIEAVVAPSFDEDALARLQKKKNLRILATGEWLPANYTDITFKKISGGLVVMDRDRRGLEDLVDAKCVTERKPSEEELRALSFNWRVCKHVKSNAIVFGLADQTVGVGAGQMSRVVAVELAAQKAGDKARGAVMASDAFFPFADGIEAAAKVGIKAVVQPGGSKKDDEVIAAANAAGMAMLFTGHRHFRH